MTPSSLDVPVILVHGWAGSARSWDSVFPALRAEGFENVVAVKLPGSPGATGHSDFTVRAAADDVARVAAESERPPLLVGHSMGAQITLLVHQIMGAALAGEIVIDPAYGSDSTPAENASWADRIEIGGHEVVREFFQSAVGHRMPLPDRKRVLDDVAATPADVIARYLRSEYAQADSIGLRARTEEAVKRRTRPVLAVHSTPSAAERESRLWSPEGSRVEVWEGHGHYLHLEDPKRFARSVAAWSDARVTT